MHSFSYLSKLVQFLDIFFSQTYFNTNGKDSLFKLQQQFKGIYISDFNQNLGTFKILKYERRFNYHFKIVAKFHINFFINTLHNFEIIS